jgi:hypothetical protein
MEAEMVNKGKKLTAFPWIELIPFGLYAIVALYLTTPTNVFYQKGLQVIQDIGVFVIPLALIAGIVLAITGLLLFKRLHGWRKTTTLVLSICHAAVFAVAACGMAVFVFLVLSGKISQ